MSIRANSGRDLDPSSYERGLRRADKSGMRQAIHCKGIDVWRHYPLVRIDPSANVCGRKSM